MYDTVFVLAQLSVQSIDFRIALHQMDEFDGLFGPIAAIRPKIALPWRLPIG